MRFVVSRVLGFSVLAALSLASMGVASAVGGASQGDGAGLRARLESPSPGSSKTVDTMGLPPGSQLLSIDDGSFESALGVTDPQGLNGSQAVFLNRFTPNPDLLPITIDTVSFLFPVSTDVGSTGLESGMPFQVLVYTDPTSNADPTVATLVRRQSFLISPSNSTFQNIALDDPVTIDQGTVYVGFTNSITAETNEAIFQGALDEDTAIGESFAYFNTELFSHFDGTVLSAATSGTRVLPGTWLIRALFSTGGSMRVCWTAAAGAGLAPPTNTRVCTAAAADGDVISPASTLGPRETLLGYNVYRGTSPGVQAVPANLFTSVGPSQTSAGSSVAPGGSFFVVTGVYAEGESPASNEIDARPGTVNSVKIKATKVVTKGAGFTTSVQVFVDGIPFVSAATVKNGTKVTQKGNLLTGVSVQAYLASHGGSARMTIRNTSGATVTREIQ